MNAILGFSQLLRRDANLTARQRAHVEVIDRNSEHLLALINDILEMSRIEANRATLNIAAFSPKALATDLIAMFGPRAEAKGVAFFAELDPDLPELAMADSGKIRQIFVNLIGNAVKFTTAGRITLRFSAAPNGEHGWLLRGEVQDTGPGIDAAELTHLFKRFEQTEVGRRLGSGTGLGLALSREFALLMNGDVMADSRPGEGAVFRVRLPLATATAGAAGALAAETEPDTSAYRLPAGRPPLRILVVDDLEDSRLFLHQLLTQTGVEVREAANGLQAIDGFAEWAPHAILMDMRMPEMGGLEAIGEIRRREPSRTVKIIALTASVATEDRAQVLAAGADAFMAKPVRASALFAELERLLDLRFERVARAPESNPAAAAADLPRQPVTEELRRKFVEAVDQADLERIQELATELGELDAVLATEVMRFAARFEYGRINEILELDPVRPA